jgi:hypothetical protein
VSAWPTSCDQLGCFWPGAGNVFWSADSQIALAFLRRYPTKLDARRRSPLPP